MDVYWNSWNNNKSFQFQSLNLTTACEIVFMQIHWWKIHNFFSSKNPQMVWLWIPILAKNTFLFWTNGLHIDDTVWASSVGAKNCSQDQSCKQETGNYLQHYQMNKILLMNACKKMRIFAFFWVIISGVNHPPPPNTILNFFPNFTYKKPDQSS